MNVSINLYLYARKPAKPAGAPWQYFSTRGQSSGLMGHVPFLHFIHGRAKVLAGKRGIDQDQPGRLIGIHGGEHLNVDAAQRLTHQNIRRRYLARCNAAWSSRAIAPRIARLGTRLGLAGPGAIVRNHLCKSCDLAPSVLPTDPATRS